MSLREQRSEITSLQSRRQARSTIPLLTVVFGVSLALRILSAGDFEVSDEQLWRTRSHQFSDAVINVDFSAASSSVGQRATMPGVTTMWAGSVGRLIWSVVDDEADVPFANAESARTATQAVMAVSTALLVTAATAVTRRWLGCGVALVVGTLLATEPYLVANGVVLHNDVFVTMFSYIGTVACVLAMLPDRSGSRFRPQSHRWVFVSGAAYGLAFLSKLSSAPLILSSVAILALGFVISRQQFGMWYGRELLGRYAAIAAVAFATAFVLWPALWTDLFGQIDNLLLSKEIASSRHPTFFRGEATGAPAAHYYLFTLPLRVTPWFLMAAVAGGVVAVLRRVPGSRVVLLVAAVATFPHLAVISYVPKKFDRYGMPLLPWAAVLAGLAVVYLARTVRSRLAADSRWSSMAPIASYLGLLALALQSALVAPWGLAYFNPLLGGGTRAVETMLVGRGEGLEAAGTIIAAESDGRCDDVVVARRYHGSMLWTCGREVPLPQFEAADFVVVYVSDRQRVDATTLAAMRSVGPLAGTVEIRGITYGEVYEAER